MMVSTFLMTFPNGHILYLGSWHHESHPTIVYEDENESTTTSAWKQINQWHWNTRDCHWSSKVLFYVFHKRFSLKTHHIPHIIWVCTECFCVWEYSIKQMYNTHLRAVKKHFRFAKDTSKILLVERGGKKGLSYRPGGFTCSSLYSLNKILIVCKSTVATV